MKILKGPRVTIQLQMWLLCNWWFVLFPYPAACRSHHRLVLYTPMHYWFALSLGIHANPLPRQLMTHWLKLIFLFIPVIDNNLENPQTLKIHTSFVYSNLHHVLTFLSHFRKQRSYPSNELFGSPLLQLIPIICGLTLTNTSHEWWKQ